MCRLLWLERLVTTERIKISQLPDHTGLHASAHTKYKEKPFPMETGQQTTASTHGSLQAFSAILQGAESKYHYSQLMGEEGKPWRGHPVRKGKSENRRNPSERLPSPMCAPFP